MMTRPGEEGDGKGEEYLCKHRNISTLQFKIIVICIII
jgi:hypothetical protein